MATTATVDETRLNDFMGKMVNDLGTEETDRVRGAYGGKKYQRLAASKAK